MGWVEMAEHSDLRSLAVDHVIEADDLGSMISTETPSSASGSAFACGSTKRSLVVPSARSKNWSRMLRSITMMALPQPAIRCRFPSDTCSDMLRRKSRSDVGGFPGPGCVHVHLYVFHVFVLHFHPPLPSSGADLVP